MFFAGTRHAARETKYSARTFTGLPYSGGFKEPMTSSEAALILGCRETSSKQVISKRFRALMKLNHPDRGGNPYLAAKINEAHALLIKFAE